MQALLLHDVTTAPGDDDDDGQTLLEVCCPHTHKKPIQFKLKVTGQKVAAQRPLKELNSDGILFII